MAKLVSKVYGDALFSLALEENIIDQIWEETKAVRDAIVENPDFLSVINHPEVTLEKKIAILDEVFKQKVSTHMMGFFNVLIQKGRFNDIISILDYFDSQAKEYKNIGVVKVSTPIPLKDNQKEQVEKRLLEVSKYEKLEIEYKVDESLLGGMVIRIGDRVLDNSISSKLENMSRQLYKVKLS